MPLRQKIRNGWTKFVFREAMKGILPEKIRLRKSKLGFVTPEDIWYKTNLSEDIESVIRNSQFMMNYIHRDSLLNAFERYQKSHTFFLNGNIFFRFYILELWGRKFMMGH
jgi:asparagine synthase (glutamine-hydrolysing)